MPKERRRLAALMFTDIVGYSAMAQRDEALALELLTEHNSLLRESFASHDGQEIKCTGDGFLVVFGSPVQSVKCALEIQSSCERRNAGVDRECRIEVRIGIHLGDVVQRDQDVFGDGVNVASRIEPLAAPGGIVVSRQVYDQVRNKVPSGFASLGRKQLKNLESPIEVFRVTAAQNKKGNAGYDRTRIAVLPLANISPDPSDAYFADGMTEELIYTLSKVSGLHVIASTASMAYKGSNKSLTDIGHELQIGTAIEGSVRKAGDRLRITTQLVNVEDQEHVWSEHYDRELEDVFAIQSDIAQCVAEALAVRLLATERRAVEKKPTDNLDAYNLYLQGCHFSRRKTASSLEKAETYFKQAIDLDPEFADAHARLAQNYLRMADIRQLSSVEAHPLAQAAAERALELDSESPAALTLLAWLSFWRDGDPAAAEEGLRHVIDRHPDFADAHRLLGQFLMLRGRLDEASPELKRAVELDPLFPLAHSQLGVSRLLAYSYDEAIESMRKALELDPNWIVAHLYLGVCLLMKGMHNEALAEFSSETTVPPSFVKPWVGAAYADMGETARARQILDESTKEAKLGQVDPGGMAHLCFALGENDRGFHYLEKAYGEGNRGLLIFMWASPRVAEDVRRDPRFVSLVKRAGLGGASGAAS